MFNLKINGVRKYDRTIPNVWFDDENIELELSKIFNTDKEMYYYFGLVLLRLGFEPEDKIVISNYEKNTCSFDCMVNDYGNYNIRINNINSNNMEIVVNRFNNEFGYVCEKLTVSEIGMKISLGRYTIKYPGGVVFTRCLSRDSAKFVVYRDDSVIELELEKPGDIELSLYDEKGCYNKYRLDNEQDIIEYLVGLNDKRDLADIYEELNKIYITDISRYPNFILKRSKLMKDGNLRIIDLIGLKNGDLDKFGKTQDEITVFVDKDDNWSFDIPSKDTFPVSFSMSKQDGVVTCNVVCNEKFNIENYINNVIDSDIAWAYEEKSKVKKLFMKKEGSK